MSVEIQEELAFDRYGSINERRKGFLAEILPGLIADCHLRTALDVGCGVGFFSHCLAEMGLTVTAFDARAENVAEAKRRYPNVAFHLYDVEDSKVLELDPADLTLCFGLLYHLENPFRAIRNIHALTRKLVVVESIVAPFRLPIAAIIDEPVKEDQSLRQVAFVASEACLVKMFYKAGFSAVYRPEKVPAHDDFRGSLRVRRRRTILVASKIGLTSPTLRRLPEPRAGDIWQRGWGDPLGRLVRFAGKRLRRRGPIS